MPTTAAPTSPDTAAPNPSSRLADPGTTTSVTLPSDTEILITREFNAPRHLVFDAWTKPEHVRRWYGFRDSNLAVCEIDLRPGGAWRWVIRDDEGEHAFSGEYVEIAAPERLVATERYEPVPGSDHVNTMTLTEHEGRTLVRVLVKYDTREARDGHIAAGMEAGMRVTLERLDEVLDDLQTDTAERQIVQTRLLNATRALVYKNWTDPAHVDHWWGPRGFTTTTHAMDVRPGGVWRFDMQMENGPTFPNTITYLEVVPPERLVYRHGSDGDADTFLVTVTFADRGPKTELTMRQVFASPAVREYVAREYNAVEGGKQTLDRLEEWLARA
jgi:uncharacterized protein YndB with AHSA1/START domain